MIRNITSSVSFPSTGKKIANSFELEPGLTAITGSNGIGKSHSASEMPRYLLFGVKALRGVRADYVDLTGEMTFEVKGSSYTVTRGPRAECLKDAAETVLAVGADAVNKRIVELFGYGLDVFDVANACTQGKVQALSDMSSPERKAMVDRLIGLDKVEAIEKSCKDEAKGLTREADALAGALGTVPVEPIEPLEYVLSELLDETLLHLRLQTTRRERLLATVAAVGEAPVAPMTPCPMTADIEALEAHQLSWYRAQVELHRLQADLQDIPSAPMTQEMIDAVAVWQPYADEIARRGPKPVMTLADVEQDEAMWLAHDSWVQAVPCLECGFGVDQEPRPRGGLESKAQLQQQRLRLDRWSVPLVEMPEPAYAVGPVQLEINRRALALQDAGLALEKQIESLDMPVLRDRELTAAKQISAAWDVWSALTAAWHDRAAAAAGAQAEADTIGDLSEPCRLASDKLDEAREYERDLLKYEADLAQHTRLSADIADRRARAEGFANGAKALRELRVEYKTHLAPSISMVASQLISGMTGGAFDRIEVNAEFDITVNGQPIRTLSGSEAAVANLALRVGLGQVLTSGVFSVFLGDEIDASMDDERAEYTAAAFRGLSAVLKQVILVSHKDIEADQLIEL